MIAGLVDAGRGEEAEQELYAYLTDAEGQLLAVYEHPDANPGPSRRPVRRPVRRPARRRRPEPNGRAQRP